MLAFFITFKIMSSILLNTGFQFKSFILLSLLLRSNKHKSLYFYDGLGTLHFSVFLISVYYFTKMIKVFICWSVFFVDILPEVKFRLETLILKQLIVDTVAGARVQQFGTSSICFAKKYLRDT